METPEEIPVENQPAEEHDKQTYEKIVVDFTNPDNSTKVPTPVIEKKPRSKSKAKPVVETNIVIEAPSVEVKTKSSKTKGCNTNS